MKSLLHLVRFILRSRRASFSVTDRELQMLLQYSRGGHTICEIGCYEVSTGVAFALDTKKGGYATLGHAILFRTSFPH